jgi:hypothetical protein
MVVDLPHSGQNLALVPDPSPYLAGRLHESSAMSNVRLALAARVTPNSPGGPPKMQTFGGKGSVQAAAMPRTLGEFA